MKKIVVTFSSVLLLFLSSTYTFSFPYSTSNEIQIYNEVPDSFLSAQTKACRERIKSAGVMSQLGSSLGCSNFSTAESVCGCVDLAFDKNKVEEFLKSSEFKSMDNVMGDLRSLDMSKIPPDQGFSLGVSKLNLIYDRMGLSGCSVEDGSSYFKTISSEYKKMREAEKQGSVLRSKKLDIQDVVFNSHLKNLGRYPTSQDLIVISKRVSEETEDPFFLETELSSKISSQKDESQVVMETKSSIINDYVRMHMQEIKRGIPSEEFKVQKIKREGCKKLMTYVSAVKEKALNDKIESNFSTFFPDSFIEKGDSDLERLERRKVVEGSIGNLESGFSMTGAPSFKKDIFYCSKFNDLKKRSEEISQNEELRMALARLEILKESALPGAVGSSGTSDSPQVKAVKAQIKAQEEFIKSQFGLEGEKLAYAYMGLKIWKVDKGVKSEVSDTGVITFQDLNESDNNQSFAERVRKRRKSMDRSVLSFTNNLKSSNRNIEFLSNSSISSDKSVLKKEFQAVPVRSSEVIKNVRKDNFFSRSPMSPSISRDSRLIQENGSLDRPFQSKAEASDSSYDDYLSKRISKLKQDQINTEKSLSDELSSTKESLEIAKLREELRAQSEEITKLSQKREEAPATEVISNTNATSTPVSFKSPLASALDNSFIDNSSEEQVSRVIDNAGAPTAVSATSYTGGVEQASSSNPVASTSGSIASGIDDGGSVSGISLTALKSFGDDVQVIDNSVLGEIRPIQVDASFAELSEEDKRLKIEELLETTQDEEVYIEFPDGKVLKFSKKEDLKKKNDAKLKDPKKAMKGEIKNRSIFSYDKLKEIFDDNKESDSRP